MIFRFPLLLLTALLLLQPVLSDKLLCPPNTYIISISVSMGNLTCAQNADQKLLSFLLSWYCSDHTNIQLGNTNGFGFTKANQNDTSEVIQLRTSSDGIRALTLCNDMKTGYLKSLSYNNDIGGSMRGCFPRFWGTDKRCHLVGFESGNANSEYTSSACLGMTNVKPVFDDC